MINIAIIVVLRKANKEDGDLLIERINFWRLCEIRVVMQCVDRTIECVDQMYFCTIVWIEEEMDRDYSHY